MSAISKIIKLSLGAVLLGGLAGGAIAGPGNLSEPGYWYADEDIRNVLKHKVIPNVHIAPSLPFGSAELVEEVASIAARKARGGKTSLVPINYAGNHWAALAVRKNSQGKLVAIYNDSFGTPLASKENSELLIATLKSVDPDIEIIDLQTHQQNDGSSCGAFTAENLSKLAVVEPDKLDAEHLREVLSKLTNAESIRLLHAELLNQIRSQETPEELQQTARQLEQSHGKAELSLSRSLRSVNGLLQARISEVGSGLSGFSSGEENWINCGVWVEGFVGKEKGSGANTDSRSRLRGITLGADYMLDDDSMVGIAYSNLQNIDKVTASSSNPSNSSSQRITTGAHIFSLYGNYYVTDSWQVSGDISYGAADIKNKLTSKNSSGTSSQAQSIKSKAGLIAGDVRLGYIMPLGEYFILSPSIGVSYDHVTINGYKLPNLQVAKSALQRVDISPKLALTNFIDTDSLSFATEIHTGLERPLWSKGKGGGLRTISGTLLPKTSLGKNGSTKERIDIGASFSVLHERVELGMGYERYFGKRLTAHLGWLKFRINF